MVEDVGLDAGLGEVGALAPAALDLVSLLLEGSVEFLVAGVLVGGVALRLVITLLL